MYINVCNSDVFSVVNMYRDHLKFYAVCINGQRYVCCGEYYVVSNEYHDHTSCIVQPIEAHGGMYLRRFFFRDELGFLNCDDICMCVVNKHFELLEFVFNSVFVDLKYIDISLTFTAGSVCVCVVMWSSLVCLCVCLCTLCGCGDCDACTIICVVYKYSMMRECDGAKITAIMVLGRWRCGCDKYRA